jgi:uncharacterized protein
VSNCVFIDSSFWIAYRDKKDAYYGVAHQRLRELLRQKIVFMTTMPVICEVHARFARNQRTREQVLNDLCKNPLVRMEDVLHQDRNQAIELLRIHTDKTYALCDALSFVVMRRLGIRRAASFDRHFKQFGEFEIVS